MKETLSQKFQYSCEHYNYFKPPDFLFKLKTYEEAAVTQVIKNKFEFYVGLTAFLNHFLSWLIIVRMPEAFCPCEPSINYHNYYFGFVNYEYLYIDNS